MSAAAPEVVDLAAIGKILTQKCPQCQSPFLLSAEVRARFDPASERWWATLSCSVCGRDVTPLARMLTALDHRHGPRTAAQIIAPTVWDGGSHGRT